MTKYSGLLLITLTALIAYSCLDDGLVSISAENKNQLLTFGGQKAWFLTDRDSEPIEANEFLVFQEGTAQETFDGSYQRLVFNSGAFSVIDSGSWTLAEGTDGEFDSLLIERDTAIIATSVEETFTTRFVSSAVTSMNITDTALIYRDTIADHDFPGVLQDSLFTDGFDTLTAVAELENPVTDTLFAILDTLFLLEDSDILPDFIPSGADTQFVFIDTSRVFFYNPLEVDQQWLISLITVDRLEITVISNEGAITENFELSQE